MAVLIGGILGGQIQGRLGGNVYSTRNGKTYVRSVQKRTAPVTEAVKKHQGSFAKAGMLCSHLQAEIKKLVTLASPSEMHNKLMSAMLYWLKGRGQKGDETSYFKNCRLTKSVTCFERWYYHVKVSPPANGTICITIPPFIPMDKLRALPLTVSVTCRIVVAALQPADGSLMGSAAHSVTFDYNDKTNPGQVIDLTIPCAEGSLIVTVMSLEFNRYYGCSYYKMSKDAQYMPAGVMSAWYV